MNKSNKKIRSTTFFNGIVFLFFVLPLLKVTAQEKEVHHPSLAIIRAQNFSLHKKFDDFEPWDIETDSLGYAYFARYGFYQFNGKLIKDKPFHSSFNSARLIGVKKGRKNQLWLKDYEGTLFVCSDDTVRPSIYNSSIKSLGAKYIENFYVDRQDTLHYAIRGRGYFKITPNGEIIDVLKNSSKIDGFVITPLYDGTLFYYSLNQKGIDHTKEGRNVYYSTNNQTFKRITHLSPSKVIYESTLLTTHDGTWIFNMGNQHIIKGHRDTLLTQKKFPFHIIKLFEDTQKNLWIGSVNKGLYRAIGGNLDQIEHIIKKGAVAVTAEDANGGLWIKSNRFSFAYLPSLNLYQYSKEGGQLPSNEIQDVTTDYQRIFYLLNKNTVAVVQGDSLVFLKAPIRPIEDHLKKNEAYANRIYYDTFNDKLYLGALSGLFQWDAKKWTFIPFDPIKMPDSKVIDLKNTSDGTLIGLTQNELFKVENQKITEVIPLPKNLKKSRVIKLAVDPMGTIFVGGTNGLWTYNGDTFTRPEVIGNHAEVIRNNVLEVVACAGNIWFQTFEDGLFVLMGKSVIPVYDSNQQQIISSGVFVAQDSTLWFEPLKGENKVYCARAGLDTIVVQQYNIDDIISTSGYIWGGVIPLGDKVYIGGKQGVFQMRKKDLFYERPPPNSNITSVYVNHALLPLAKHYDLAYDKNSIIIDFESISFRSRKKINLRCRLLGFSANWTLPKYNSMQYTNLEPGNYRFQVQSRILEERWGPVKEIFIHIATPFWQTWWFRALMSLIFILVLYGIFQYRLAQIRRKEQYKSNIAVKMARLELKALKAQLNPHFIFNSITSVMYYLANGEAKNAAHYLQRFSKLIRSVLEHSDQSTISLDQELELLRHYVALEAERFEGEKIQFKVSFGKLDLKNIFIPPALFQPYIENALWHGLQHKKGSKIISIQGEKEGEFLKISIQDNGVGRKKAEQQTSTRKAQRSYGMMIASKRIELFNQKEVEEIRIIDLKDHHNHPKGTKVVFYIPINTQPGMNL